VIGCIREDLTKLTVSKRDDVRETARRTGGVIR
jgi:hypothetical protein